MKILDLFLAIDGFGEPIELNFKGQKRFNTICGSLITSFVYIVFILYSVQQGISFVQKNDIEISSYNIIDLEGAQEILNLKEQRGGVIFNLKKRDKPFNYDAIADLDPRDAGIEVH